MFCKKKKNSRDLLNDVFDPNFSNENLRYEKNKKIVWIMEN